MIIIPAFLGWVLFHGLPMLLSTLLAQKKYRWRIEGFLLAFFLSWIGWFIEWLLPDQNPPA